MKGDVFWSDVLMDSWQDCVFLFSMSMKLFLSTLIIPPIKVNFRSFVYVLYNAISDDAVGKIVVKLNWCWTLDVAHIM